MPDKHKIHLPDISDRRLAMLGKMAAAKNSVLEWVDEETSSSSAQVRLVDLPTHNHPATADRPPGYFSEPEKGYPMETRKKLAVSFLEDEPFDSSNPEGKAYRPPLP